MADDPDPPRKFYGFKPTEFERDNPTIPAAGTNSPDVPGPNPADGPIDVHTLIRQGSVKGPILRRHAAPGATAANEVHAILADNLTRANAAGLNDVAPPTRPHRRRRRDYWLVLIIGNTFIGGLYATEMLFGFQVQCIAAQMPNEFWNLVRFAIQNPATYAMGLVGMVFFTGCLTWLMYGVMENY